MDMNHPELIEKHKQFMSEFELKGLDYVIYGGVMLGLVRDNNLIEWDPDLDYGFLEKDFVKVEKILQDMGYKKTTKNNIQQNMYIDSSPNKNGKMLQLNLGKIHYIDFKFFHENERQKLVFNTVNLPNYPVSYITESEIITYNDVQFRLPKQKQEWIEYDYGSNWNKPIKSVIHNDWLKEAKNTWKKINK